MPFNRQFNYPTLLKAYAHRSHLFSTIIYSLVLCAPTLMFATPIPGGGEEPKSIPGAVAGTQEEWWNFNAAPGVQIPVLTIKSAHFSLTKKRPALIWWSGSEDTHPMYGRWLSELTTDDDMIVYSVGDRGVTPLPDGSTVRNEELQTNNIEIQKRDLIQLAEKLSKDPCVSNICVCSISGGGAVAAKAAAESSHIDKLFLISPLLDLYTRVAHFQRKNAALAWLSYYGIDGKNVLALSKEKYEAKPKFSSKEGIASLPEEYQEAAAHYGPKTDETVSSYFKENPNGQISVENIKTKFLDSYDFLERSDYDFIKDPDHLSPKNLRSKFAKLAKEVQANNSLRPAFEDIEEMRGKNKSVVIYHGENDSLVPIAGFARLAEKSLNPEMSFISPFFIRGRGHDLIYLSRIHKSHWLQGDIPDDPVRRLVLKNIREVVRGEKPTAP